jgi:gluconokinase
MNVHDELLSVGPQALIVMGVSGSGKTTLATALAEFIGCPFFEGDAFHSPSSVQKMQSGIPLTDEDRWPWLERLGRAIGAAVTTHGIAVASCSALKKIYRDRLREAIAAPVGFVLPDASRDELLRRMTHRSGHYMPPTLLTSQLATLERPEADELAISIDARTPTALSCEAIVAWLSKAHGSALRPIPVPQQK